MNVCGGGIEGRISHPCSMGNNLLLQETNTGYNVTSEDDDPSSPVIQEAAYPLAHLRAATPNSVRDTGQGKRIMVDIRNRPVAFIALSTDLFAHQ